MTTALAQRYQHSVETQERLKAAPRYNRWICDLISPYITGRVLDIGSALGNITQHFLDRPELVSIDIEQPYIDHLNRRFGGSGRFRATLLDASDDRAVEVLGPNSFDAAMCLNVIEHIPDDQAVLRNVAGLLKPGGHFAVVAPAMPCLYGAMDEADHHCRRYTRRGMVELFQRAGLEVLFAKYFNLIGAIGWLYYGRILRREFVPQGKTLSLADCLIRIGRTIEAILPPPMGQSVLCVGRRASR